MVNFEFFPPASVQAIITANGVIQRAVCIAKHVDLWRFSMAPFNRPRPIDRACDRRPRAFRTGEGC